ncbi:DUF885 domain-containing protein [Herbiconiux sp. L3-i23]|uniref:DUF885 domain-containing protein n=1 Tax=Herbiconiux sp. L3-i23 TaxID=2905871 RepID=UPI00206B1FE7|nr:DUF885 domain-containing protein [Herbiconiux sp. L3-i23]BDI22749.1 hypothetical protein L3i23_15250 [Herbiconiux sp. L3-i23]
MSEDSTARPARDTPIDRIADEWIDTVVELSPEFSVWLGRSGGEGRYGDLSPSGHDARADAARRTRAQLQAAEPVDAVDEVTKLDLLRDLDLALENHDAEVHLRDLNVIASPAQDIREIFDVMPTDTAEQWEHIAMRLAAVDGAVDGYIATLRTGIERGVVPAIRQVEAVAAQTRESAASDGFFASMTSGASVGGVPVSDALRRDLEAGSILAMRAYARLTEFLETELAPVAGKDDAVGRDRYALASRGFLGASVDLDETYEWGLEELARDTAEQEAIAREIVAGGGVQEAIASLDSDASRMLDGTDALKAWMQDLSDRAIDELGRSEFDIPVAVRALECLIAPTHTGGIYYTPPTEDFSRPGRMWWSVPTDVTSFATWREKTTVYHEGVPGHHLQNGIAIHNRAALNSWRRNNFVSGHGEGWALYAERLMDELGYLTDPADRLGMLDAQRMRSARVVLDIGVHLRKQRPDGAGVWDAASALDFMRANSNTDDSTTRFEVDRYLGWPGQAPSYKVGQRMWGQIRAERARREGAGFDAKAFHRGALELGGVGLDTLRTVLLG